MSSAKPSKQRRAQVKEVSLFIKSKRVRAHLSDELRENYGVRSLRVRRGDVVRVLRGDFAGTEGKVIEVDTKRSRLAIEGITRKKSDGTPVYQWIHSSKVMITKLNLDDPIRKETIEKLKPSKGEVKDNG
jgi:large subunit ribosomal protein L24